MLHYQGLPATANLATATTKEEPAMGLNLPAPNAGANAPEVDAGLALVRFDDLVLKPHPDWAGTDKFGKEDSGDRYHFQATLLDADRKTVYGTDADGESTGDPIELEAMSRTATGSKSNFAKLLKGVLTTAEFTAWEANEPFDDEAIKGRILNAMVGHNKNGWPQIDQFLGQPSGKAGKKSKAQLQAEAAAALAAAEAAGEDD